MSITMSSSVASSIAAATFTPLTVRRHVHRTRTLCASPPIPIPRATACPSRLGFRQRNAANFHRKPRVLMVFADAITAGRRLGCCRWPSTPLPSWLVLQSSCFSAGLLLVLLLSSSEHGNVDRPSKASQIFSVATQGTTWTATGFKLPPNGYIPALTKRRLRHYEG
ncbi:hypothetical protein MUK42_00119 [Musa troglodytarum]|uniref:Uncharacterized protein n=1 Tax=Musa troglodytarum TaxID=320322 RepID=A0A9E7EN47_9LILI|nr:hypothetical protein MUK42_00119 [Musa troglodytarum]